MGQGHGRAAQADLDRDRLPKGLRSIAVIDRQSGDIMSSGKFGQRLLRGDAFCLDILQQKVRALIGQRHPQPGTALRTEERA